MIQSVCDKKGKQNMIENAVYNKDMKVSVLRDQVPYAVSFNEIKAGDHICDMSGNLWFIASGDAHLESDQEGWVVCGEDGGCYYPEDLGAKALYEQIPD